MSRNRKKYMSDWYRRNRERAATLQKEWYKRNPTYHYDRNQRLRATVFNHYGWACAWCGESWFDVLTIDHINGDGAEHRKSLHRSGVDTYRWILKHGFPPGFQTLCFSCNWLKRNNIGNSCLPIKRKGMFEKFKQWKRTGKLMWTILNGVKR